MAEESSFNEVVNIIWNIEQPETAIERLLSKLTQLETKLDAVAAKAATVNTGGGGGGSGGYGPETINVSRIPAGQPGAGRFTSGGFSNVSRSGEGSPSGIGAQYIPEGRRRYTFGNADASTDWALAAPESWRPKGAYGYAETDDYRWQQTLSKFNPTSPERRLGLQTTGTKNTDQLFNDLKRFNEQAAEELAYYKSMWQAATGGGTSALAAISSSQSMISAGGGSSEVGGAFYAINAPWRYLPNQAQIGPGGNTGLLNRGYSAGPQVPLPPVGWYQGGGGAGGPGGAIPMGPGPNYGPNQVFGVGPYSNYRMASTYQSNMEAAANFMWNAGRPQDFEAIMQGDWNAGRIASARGQAAINEFQAGADLGALGGPPPIGSGRYSQRAYLGAQLNDLGAQMNSASIEGRWADVDRLGKALKDTQEQYDALGDKVSLFDSKFMRHVAHIAAGIVIWGAINASIAVVRTFIQELNNLETVQARLGFINGSTISGTAEQSALSAQYGMTPIQSGAGAIAGAQLGLSPNQMNQARQLSVVFGADQYANATQEIYQTQKTAASVGVDNVDILGFMATAYKTASGSLETYGDALQQGILLSKDLGVQSEQAGLSLLKMSQATEEAPSSIARTLQTVISHLREGPTQEKLKANYGITVTDIPTTMREITDQVTQLVASGNIEKAKSLIDIITGGLNAPARRLQLLTDFQELNTLFGTTNTELESMNKLVDSIGNTGALTWQRLTASVSAYADAILAANLAQNGGKPEFKFFELNPIKAIPETYNNYKIIGDAIGDYFRDQANRTNYTTDTGLPSQNFVPRDAQGGTKGSRGYEWQDTPAYLDWLNKQNEVGDLASEANRYSLTGKTGYSPAGPATPGGALPPEYGFGGFQTFEKGWDWNKFTSDVTAHEKLLKDVPGYDVERKQVAFWDESSQSYKYMIADLNAIRFATDEQRKLMQQQITGTFNVPAGGSALISYYAAASNFIAAIGQGKLAGSTSTNASIGGTTSSAAIFGAGKDVTGVPLIARPGFHDSTDSFTKRDGDFYAGIPDEARNSLGGAISNAGRNSNSKHQIKKDALNSRAESERQSQSQGHQLQAITVNNVIRVYIDGRQVAHSVQRQNYNQFSNIRNSAFTSPSSQVAI